MRSMDTVQVRPEGNLASKIAFVGEAPGAEEARARTPFVGEAGKLLNNLLHSAGISRGDCYITNVVKERPKDNDISFFIEMGRTKVAPTQAYKDYEELLYEELKASEANVIVAVGNIALYALTRQVGIRKWRGSILPAVKELDGRKVIPMLHPAGALPHRDYLSRYPILRDLIRIKREAEFPEIVRPERTLVIRPSLAQVMDFIDCCDAAPNVAVDIETAYNRPSCIGLSFHPRHSICIPFIEGAKDYWTPDEEAIIMRRLAKLFISQKTRKVFQNANFDMTILLHYDAMEIKPIEDIMVMHNLLYPDLPKSLAYTTSIYTDEPYYKDEGEDVRIGAVKDWEGMWRYNAKDAAVTLEIYERLLPLVEAFEVSHIYRAQTDIIHPIQWMQEHGIRCDVASLRKKAAEEDAKIAELKAQMKTLMGVSELDEKFFNSPKQLMAYFYRDLGFAPYIDRDTHKPTLDDDALKRLSRRGCPQADIMRKIRHSSKLSDTYLKIEIDPDGRFRSNYNPARTKTGRLASSETLWGTGGNAQNLVGDIKAALLPDEGHVAVEIDLSQAENRIVAWVAPEPTMKDAFIRGEDIHSKTYALMFNIPVDQVSKVKGSSPIGNGTKSQRDWGKQFNHSLNYGRGYKAFSLSTEIPEAEAKPLVERYFEVYPGVRNGFHSTIQFDLRTKGYITNCYGRRRRFMGMLDQKTLLEAYAQIPQSTVADKISLDGLLYVWENPQIFKLLKIVNQVHDSLWLLLPLDHLVDACEEFRLLSTALERPVPWKDPFVIPAEAKAGLSFASMSTVGFTAKMAAEEIAKKIGDILNGAKAG